MTTETIPETEEAPRCWCQQAEWGHAPEHVRFADRIVGFTDEARLDMASRMVDGLRREWGTRFEQASDEVLKDRLFNAETDFKMTLRQFRKGTGDLAEVRKRAADIANYAFMLADPERLAKRG